MIELTEMQAVIMFGELVTWGLLLMLGGEVVELRREGRALEHSRFPTWIFIAGLVLVFMGLSALIIRGAEVLFL